MKPTATMVRLMLLTAGLLTGGLFPGTHPAFATQTAPSGAVPDKDIRILIDVSGSMRWNDPENLRAPALRLITGLLPRDSRAGVWTFGRYVNMLVPYGTVDPAWKERAQAAAERITSAGLFTDIETTLAEASWDWNAPAEDLRRSIILLTDGLVDVSTDDSRDRDSRTRIVADILPRLQRAGVAVYPIALSGEADEVLLQQLAAATGGWFEKAQSAADLERIFFRMFEKAVEPDTLPLIENQVLVDESVDEITLLVFREQDAPPTTLKTPDGVTFGEERLPPNVRWHRDARYDLVTIEKPMTGTWRVNAALDPDNRVMVVTNLRVIATRLPNQILAGDRHEFFVRLTENDRVIEKREFLHFIKVAVTRQSENGDHREWMLLDNGRDNDAAAGDGTYTLVLDEDLPPGRHRLTVTVDGTTFKRRHQQMIEVVTSPVVATIKPEGVNGEQADTLYVIPRADIIVPDSLQVTATIGDPDGGTVTRTVPRTGPNEWRLALGEYAGAPHRLVLDISAERPSGKPLAFTSEPLTFGASGTETSRTEVSRPEVSGAESPADAAPAKEEAPATAATPQSGSEPAPPADPAPAQPAGTSWILVIALVVLINLIIGGAAFFAYRKWSGGRPRPNPWDDLAHE